MLKKKKLVILFKFKTLYIYSNIIKYKIFNIFFYNLHLNLIIKYYYYNGITYIYIS